ncbi:P-loop containing nucleoside triphosphate hydrolase protein [Crepidotus variabilis]|uniref:Structural maintenance of chromosomes protein 5 n=1 Tax=Crepidotus variabilis TaxID=179855 RepID=A0A9P6JPU3_9AGAR|nr:P-loop containing nucleoside triphosphate hydrolase protein [Crepidotus variabilis]
MPPSKASSSTQAKKQGAKVKREKVKEEKSSRKRREVTPEEPEEEPSQDAGDEEDGSDGPDEPENATQNPEDEDEGSSPRGTKRRRINGDGDSATSDQDEDQEVALPKVTTLPRGADGYIPGSIVRIQLCNFVTYDFVEFTPGPYLNMIIGPNGTGKSSIACAIALGLNFPPQILGRATELNQFVKNGQDSGYIEIELKGPNNQQNLIIRRHLKASSRASTFTLNGQAATGNEIKVKMAELNVQVGNLCSFLPQDRVSEFAAMTSQQLLRETQRAAGDENLTKWHDALIESGKEFRALQATIKVEDDTLKQMKDRNDAIERDVKRFLERKKIEHDIALLNLLIPVAQYRETRNKFMEAKQVQRQLHTKVKQLQKKNEPAHDLLKHMDTDFKNADTKRETLKKSTQQKFKQLTDKNKASDNLEAESLDIVEKLANLKKEEKDRTRQINSLENEIVKLQAEVDRDPPDDLPNEEELRQVTRQLNLEKAALASRSEEFNSKMRECVDKKAYAKSKFEHAEKSMKELDNVDTQRLEAMARWDIDTADAIRWVRDNRDKFKMEVFETPFMRLTIPDKKFADAVEACFNSNQIKTFVAQCQEDVDTLNHSINDEGALGRKARITTWFRPYDPQTIVPPPMSQEELELLKFNGYAIDYVDCPDAMKYFLRKELNLHRTAIALNGSAINVGQAMNYVARPIPEARHAGGANFINGNTLNIVTRSRYGSHAVSNMTRDIQKARSLTKQAVDPENKQRIDAEMREAHQEMEMWEEEKNKLKSDNANLSNQQQDFDRREADIRKQKKKIADENQRKVTASAKLASRKTALKSLLAKPSAESQRTQFKTKLIANNKKRMEFAKQYTNLVHLIIHEQQECTRFGIHYLQVAANRHALQALCDRKDVKHQNAVREYTEANELFQRLKAQSKEILEESRRVLNEAPDDVQEDYHKQEQVRLDYDKALEEAEKNGTTPPSQAGVELRTADELQAELENQKATLELNMITNPGVVEQYEKRKRDIETLEKTLADRKKREERLQKQIKGARDNWHPALKKLVGSIGKKFSAAFDRIGCAGEIRINENEEYEKWAIDILVKFRDSEKLQLLTAQRQSGGERALTTILYLMSLTEEARAPFSLVDEINQGMDQRAERVVHNSMVNVTCKPDSAQYFLITPKLLPDLDYHQRMRILCVNNGEWLPEDRMSGKMSSMIDVYLKAKNG